MQENWLNISTESLAIAVLLLVFFALGGLALRRLQARKQRALAQAFGRDADDQAIAPVRAQDAQQPAAAETETATATATENAALARAQLTDGLTRTRASLWEKISSIFSGKHAYDEEVLEALEAILLTADVGVRMTTELLADLSASQSSGAAASLADLRGRLRTRLLAAFEKSQKNVPEMSLENKSEQRPQVTLFVGVNGVGKTTSIAKLAQRFVGQNKKVLLAAGDTFRAAAAEQLALWASRTGADITRGEEACDPASVMFTALRRAQGEGHDILLADTAGRLHTRTELMDEIQKVRRAFGKVMTGAPHETWLVVDATTGQNALQQAREFHQALGLTGLVLTKLDGTARGGVVIAIAHELGLPVRYIGIGERAEDLMPFDATAFVDALLTPPAA